MENRKKIKLFLISIIISFLLSFCFETLVIKSMEYAFDYIFWLSLLLSFISLNIVFDFNKVWEFIYKKRYIIGGLLFSIIVAFGYNGSSISVYNEVVQPNMVPKYSNPLLFEKRSIRSDEWAVNAPLNISQFNNNLKEINPNMMGGGKNLSLFPRVGVANISILSLIEFIGFVIPNINIAYSFYWNIGYFALFFSSFELFMLLTKGKKKYSFLGAIMILFSPAVMWWEQWQLITYGSICIVLFNKYLSSKCSLLKSIILSILIAISFSSYIRVLYPAWMITFGYFFLVLLIWCIIINKNNINFKKIIMFIIPFLISCSIILIPMFINGKDALYLMSNTVYPGERFSIGGYGWKSLFNYITSIFTPFVEHPNACESSQFFSLFPLPIIMGIYYVWKNRKQEKKDLLLISLLCLTIFLLIWNFIEIPAFISRISLLYMSTPERSQVTVGFLNIILIVYLLSRYENSDRTINFIDRKNIFNAFLAVALGGFCVYIANGNYFDYFSKEMVLVGFVIVFSLFYMLLTNNKYLNNYIVIIMIVISICIGFTVHPVQKGLGAILDKPVSKEIQKIVKNNSNALWATIDVPFYTNNFVLANGGRIINSTNYYPNYDLWDKLDSQKQYEHIYNRYSHINMYLGDSRDILLKYEDAIDLTIQVSDLCLIDIKYILSNNSELDNLTKKNILINKIYAEDDIYIYDVICK